MSDVGQLEPSYRLCVDQIMVLYRNTGTFPTSLQIALYYLNVLLTSPELMCGDYALKTHLHTSLIAVEV